MRIWAILLDLVTKGRFLVIFSLIFFSWASVQEWQMCRTRTSRRRSGGISPTSTQPFLTPAGATAWSCSPPASMGPGSFLVSSRLVNRVSLSITLPGAIYYMILYIHGDLALTESKEEPPCIDNVSGFLEFFLQVDLTEEWNENILPLFTDFASCFLFSLETQHTIGCVMMIIATAISEKS